MTTVTTRAEKTGRGGRNLPDDHWVTPEDSDSLRLAQPKCTGSSSTVVEPLRRDIQWLGQSFSLACGAAPERFTASVLKVV
jgi:hypothetical protein